MKILSRAVLRGWGAAFAGLVATLGMSGPAAPAAQAATAPPHFADGFGLTVVSQPKWAGPEKRTFVITVKSRQVPAYDAMEGQVPGEHVLMVTLPTGYNGAAATRYPVLYHLHGAGDRPNSVWTKTLAEQATKGAPLITVTPNGSGHGWYTNWRNPGSRGPQNWETFHLKQVIPFIDANLKTIAAKAGRAIVGHSMGGFGAFHYAEDRPDLFRYAGSFSADLDLQSPWGRGAVVGSGVVPSYGKPYAAPDAIFGSPLWPADGAWNEASPAHHVKALRGMGVALYTGDGGNLLDNPVQAAVEKGAQVTTATMAEHLKAAGIPYRFVDYGDGSRWAKGCTGKHAQFPCLQADMNDYVKLIMKRLRHP
ncbi:esterase [Streptomyces sioyaensis]|uniref:alpha/beta hydrolase n=1 Tax=Streptomyces sioyaensis TaxID=67364 RepID=UPI001F2E7DE4|nr:alpha/beta hydrolase family protein [Streptomyces sioyaensis]MCF3173827.1 esterase [Streptomyces sioyaensis]